MHSQSVRNRDMVHLDCCRGEGKRDGLHPLKVIGLPGLTEPSDQNPLDQLKDGSTGSVRNLPPEE